MSKSRGSTKIITEREIKQLELKPHVQNVNEKSITYSATFKLAAVQDYKKGRAPMDIFLSAGAGFDLDIIGRTKPLATNLCPSWGIGTSRDGE
ncbi:hypothetical protein [Paenibacillus terrae]|uniref:hypothetical protein n=1 Tax=Paenibacillus terrae TaxID=159743 RepID=UPI0006962B1E|nr:hypothetical protein [Paenibacillus terrae]